MYAFVFLFFTISSAVLAQTPKPSSSPSETKADEMSPGLIVLTAFEGDVKIASAKNPVGIPPSAGAKLQMGDIILTGSNSSASLAFSNGSVLQVQSGSKFSIEEYLQKPWDFDEAAFKKLEKEPTASKTKLKLDYGDVICNVKKLSSASEMTVSTPLGVAGIRGTQFKLSITLDSQGKPSASKLSVVEGAVALSSQGGGQAPLLVTSGLSSLISVNPAADGTFTIVFGAPLTENDMVAITKIADQIMKEKGEFVMSAITAEIKKQEDAKRLQQGDQKLQVSSPNTGAASDASIAVAAAAQAKAEAEANTLSGFSLSPNSVTYGDLAPKIKAPTSNNKAVPITYSSSNTSVATVSGSTITIVGAGTTTIKANQAAKGLFPAASVTQSLTVKKANQTITLPAIGAKTYGDAAFNLNATTDSNLTLSYSSSDEDVATVSAAGVVTIKSNGAATITASQAGNANYNAATSATATLTVGKKALTVTGAGVTPKVYDGTATATITGTLSGAVVGDDVTLTASGTFADANAGTGKTVTSSSTLAGTQASRYTLTQPNGLTGSITKAVVTVTAASANKNAGESDPTLTYTPNPTVLIAGNSFSGSFTREVGENAGTYAINQGTLSAGDNYAITFVGATFTINNSNTTPVLSGFGLTPSSITYGDTAPTINPTTSNSQGAITYSSSDTNVATISGSTLVIVGVGTTTITASQVANGTYGAAGPVTAVLTVSPKALTITGAAVASKTYDGTATATIISGSLSGVVGSDAVTLTLSGTFADADAGTGKTVTSSSTLAGAQASRYTLTQPTGLTGTITKAVVTVTAASANKEAGASDPTLTYTTTPSVLIAGNSFSGNLVRDSGEEAGTYTITKGTLDAGNNYAITFQPATFTINQDGVIITVLSGFNLDNHKVSADGNSRSARIIAPTSTGNTNGITYSLNPSEGNTINGLTVTLTVPCTISAKQEAGLFDGVEYSAASASITLKWEKKIDEEFISNK